jgi:hypothetical protein
MPLLDHFHPPLHGPRRWEGFLDSWATFIAQQLNQGVLPSDYFAEPDINLGPELEILVARPKWSPGTPHFIAPVEFSRLDAIGIHVYQDLGGPTLRAAIELVTPDNKNRPARRRTFAAKCAGYLQNGMGLVIIDIVTAPSANLQEDLFDTLEMKSPGSSWRSSTGLYAVAHRAVTARQSPRLEVWAEELTLGKALPVLPLWLSLDLCVPVQLEESYLTTCRSLRIPAKQP